MNPAQEGKSPFNIPPNDVARVLVLDDDEQYRDALRKLLADQGLVVDVASTTDEAEKYLASRSYQIVTTDIYHPGEARSGDEFILELNPSMQGAKTVVITRTKIENIKHVKELQALGVTLLEKGSHEDRLKDIIAEVFLTHRASQPDTKVSTESSEEGYNEHFEASRDQVAHLYERADSLLSENRFREATDVYRAIIGILPSELDAYGKLRDVLERLGRTEEAKQVAGEVEERFPVGDAGEVSSLGTSSRGSSQGTARTPATSSSEGPKLAHSVSSATGLPYSQSSLRSMSLAEELRIAWNRPEIRRTVLLCGLLAESPDSPVSTFMSSLGISKPELLDLIGGRLVRGPARITAALIGLKTSTNELIDAELPDRLALTQNALDALRVAHSIAQELGDDEIEPRHIFAGLMRSDEEVPGWIGWMLGEEKAQWIRSTLDEWPKGSLFTEESVRQKAVEAGLYSPASASSDAASKDDLLNFKHSANAMVNIILKQDTVPPLVIGVYGPWGSGKSTYMELVKKELLSQYNRIKKSADKSTPVDLLVVEYDAWAYSDAPKLWAGLITRIAKKLDEDLGLWGRTRYMFNTHRRKLLSGILLGLIPLVIGLPVFAFGLVKSLPSWAPSPSVISAVGAVFSAVYAWLTQRQAVFKNVSSLASKFDSAPASGVINSIQDEFKDALESWITQKTGSDSEATIEQRVRNNNLKIVVFIDELDRCPLERIVDILEAIKLFLAKEIFIVFMAVDTRVASEAIRLHYKDVRNPDLPREYLEKIVQLPLRVPKAKRNEIDGYLRKFMPNVQTNVQKEAQPNPSARRTSPAPEDSVTVPTLNEKADNTRLTVQTKSVHTPSPTVTRPGRKRNVTRTYQEPSPTFSLPQLPDTQIELELLAAISEELLDSNPRRIKRLLNTYRYIKVLSHGLKEPVQTAEWQKTMLGWLAFTMTWPAFMAKAIERVPELEPDNDSFLLRAIDEIPGRDPKPSKVDVQAYLNVSGKRIKELWELAGNFLIENADPGSVSHTDRRTRTRGESSV